MMKIRVYEIPQDKMKEIMLVYLRLFPGLYADDFAERLGISERDAVELLGLLTDEGLVEHCQDADAGSEG